MRHAVIGFILGALLATAGSTWAWNHTAGHGIERELRNMNQRQERQERQEYIRGLERMLTPQSPC